MSTKKSSSLSTHNQLGPILAELERRNRAITAARKTIEACCAVSVDTGSPLVDPFQLQDALKTASAALAHDCPPDFEELGKWAQMEADRVNADFESRLKKLCTLRDYTCAGHFPGFDLEGFITVQVNPAKRHVQVGSQIFRTMLVDTIFPEVERLIKEDRARMYDPTAFLSQLTEAYERVVRTEGISQGEPAFIRAVGQQMIWLKQTPAFWKSGKRTLFQEYTLANFARDLGRNLSAQKTLSADGRQLILTPTSLAGEGLEIRQDSASRIYGRLAFKAPTA